MGSVGSGKSSLIQAIIGEMPKVSGKVSITGEIAYCPQTVSNHSQKRIIICSLGFKMQLLGIILHLVSHMIQKSMITR